MGILSSGLRAKSFLFLGGVRYCRSPRTPAAASGAGFGGAEPPCGWVFFLLERFLFVFRGEFSRGQSAIRKRTSKGIDACIMTYSGREEERAPSIYRSSSWSRSAAMSRVRRSKGFSSVGKKVFLLSKKGPPSGERLS